MTNSLKRLQATSDLKRHLPKVNNKNMEHYIDYINLYPPIQEGKVQIDFRNKSYKDLIQESRGPLRQFSFIARPSDYYFNKASLNVNIC